MAPLNLSELVNRIVGTREEPYAPQHLLDPLTRLPTRPAVVRELKNCLAKSHNKRPVALAIVDFSNVQGLVENGDAVDPGLLQRLATLLRTRAGEGNLVGHLRDREFAVILCGMPISEVERVADEIINSVRSDISLEAERRYIATIVGIGYSSKGDCRAPQLMGLADIALHYALATGRGCHVIVDQVPAARAA